MSEIKAYEGKEPYLFISYSHSDPLAMRIIEALDNYGFRLWYDKGIKSGSLWLETIAERIENCRQFILLLSPNAANSQYVQSEIFCAYDCKKDIPTLHANDPTSGLPPSPKGRMLPDRRKSRPHSPRRLHTINPLRRSFLPPPPLPLLWM